MAKTFVPGMDANKRAEILGETNFVPASGSTLGVTSSS